MDILQVDAHLIVSETVQLRWYIINFSLIQSINLWWWEVGDPVSQNRSISPLQQNSQATPEVVDRLALLLSRVPGKRRAKFLDLPLPNTML